MIDLESLVKGIKNSIEIMDSFERETQNILDTKYKSLKLKALSTYARPYINCQPTIAIFKEEDWDNVKRDNIIFSMHFDELQPNAKTTFEPIIAERIAQSVKLR